MYFSSPALPFGGTLGANYRLAFRLYVLCIARNGGHKRLGVEGLVASFAYNILYGRRLYVLHVFHLSVDRRQPLRQFRPDRKRQLHPESTGNCPPGAVNSDFAFEILKARQDGSWSVG